ncbi:hypothetical protein SAMN05421823_11719 [Catalinimonas alkaloidigena]|uniref:Uncharacterized protein n=1 Tax=Catalinimonas alkaloidigena TaxID=1075417 RepID=A0A1G9UMY3_9BACT|nr:hypothetical protein [Catalinimonas alkaloidigena]SDM61269.1 hypothetical protein SAMN05421823_11719 [Catalinimonas alkaloidigena]
MDKKAKEEFWFMERFLDLCPAFPKGELRKLAPTEEPPDFQFLVSETQRRWGIELTQLHNEPYGHDKFSQKQRHEMEEEIVRRAEKLFLDNMNLPMNVTVSFRRSANFPKREWDAVGSEIAKIVLKGILGHNLNESFLFSVEHPLPAYLYDIRGYFIPSITESVWYNSMSKAVPDPKPDQILDIIRSKERKIANYKVQYHRKCLLIVEGMVPYSWFDDFSEIRDMVIPTLFDHVYILHTSDGRTPISELTVKRPE